MNETLLRQKIKEFSPIAPMGQLRVLTETSEFMEIKAGDVLELDGRFFLVRGEETEGRFGLDGEPKFWVKRAIDLDTGAQKIIKLVFHESFKMRLGELEILCHRSPEKEARILEKVKGDRWFMQGSTVIDPSGNHVRIIDKIPGRSFYDFFLNLDMDHWDYFKNHFPGVFRKIIECVEAIDRLHKMGELHGDIRNDHIFVQRKTEDFIWIDFDYTYEWSENHFGVDLFGLGNVLLFTVGKGFHTMGDLTACGPEGMEVSSCLGPEDMSLFFPHRIINLKKIFPYIPESLNTVLLFFSQGADVFYETSEELLKDLKRCERDLS